MFFENYVYWLLKKNHSYIYYLFNTNWFFIYGLLNFTHKKEFFIDNKFNNLLVKKNKNVPVFLKRKLFFSFFISNRRHATHLSHSIFINKEYNAVKNYLYFDTRLWVQNLNNIMNLTYNILLNNQKIYVLSDDVFHYETSNILKFIFGLSVYNKYSMLFSFDKYKWRSYKWQTSLRDFFADKDIKVLFFVNVDLSPRHLGFFQSLKIITSGVYPQHLPITPLNYWLPCDSKDLSIRYLFLSSIYSLYALSMNENQKIFYKNYNIYFIKLIFNKFI